jgi:hypothetical protein
MNEPSIDQLAEVVMEELHKQAEGLDKNAYLILLTEVYIQIEGLIEARLEENPEISREDIG